MLFLDQSMHACAFRVASAILRMFSSVKWGLRMQCPSCQGAGITSEGKPCFLCASSGSLDADSQAGNAPVLEPDHGFTFTADDEEERYDFEVRGAGIGGGVWAGILFAGALLGAPITFLLTVERGTGTVVFLTFLACIGVAFLFALGLHLFRSSSQSFILTTDAVHVDGYQIRKSDVSALVIRSGDGDRVTQAPVSSGRVVLGFGAVGAAAAGAAALSSAAQSMGAAAGHSIKDSLGRNSYAICLVHGRRQIPLVENLDRMTAIALFQKVASVF